jgi:hypothetical protein
MIGKASSNRRGLKPLHDEGGGSSRDRNVDEIVTIERLTHQSQKNLTR